MKKILAVLCALTMVCTVLFGCSNNSQSSSSSSSASSSSVSSESSVESSASSESTEPVTLRYMWWGSQTRHDQNIKMLEMYMEQHPNVTVEYEYGGFDTYWDKLAAMAAANNLPDVIQMSVAYILSYADKGQLVDLAPYINSGVIDCSDWEDVFVNLGVIDGKNYGLTLGNSAYCVVYDPDLFAQAGVAEPTLDWTWDDYLSAIKTIKEKTGVYGDCQFPSSIMEGYQQFLRQNGEIGLVNEARDELTYKETDLWTKLFTMHKEQLDAGYVVPFDQAVTMQAIEQTGIATGQSAMMGVLNSNQAVAASNALGKDLKITCFPHDPDEKQPGTFIGPTMFLCISESSQNKDAAADLINFLLNDPEANKLCQMEKGVPASKAVREAVEPLLTETGKAVSQYVGEMAKIVPDYDNIYPVAYSEVNDLYNKLVQDMMFGSIDIEEAGQQFISESDALLKAGASK